MFCPAFSAEHKAHVLCHQQGGPGSPDLVASGSDDRTVRIWCAATRNREAAAHVACGTRRTSTHAPLKASAPPPNNRRSRDLRQPPQWACVQLLQHQASVSCLQLSDWVLASGAGNGFISLWDVRAGGASVVA